jgi:hypothetical protein
VELLRKSSSPESLFAAAREFEAGRSATGRARGAIPQQ